MTIRTRYNLTFNLLTTFIILFFAGTIYWVAKKNREKEYFGILKNEAIIKANLFAEEAVTHLHLQQIYANQRLEDTDEIHIAIYNTNHQLLYQDLEMKDSQYSTQDLLGKITIDKELKLRRKINHILGINFKSQGKIFVILASGNDIHGRQEMYDLRIALGIIACIAIFILYILGYYFSKRLVRPITEMTKEINKITAAHLDLRLKPLKHKDELNQLGEIFNQMLDRLENSFDSQKEFVAHISHELRTPLAAMITDLELTLNHNRDSQEYKETLERTLLDAKKIVGLSNNLLDLAKANYEPQEIGYSSLRIDEVLLEAYQEMQMSSTPCSVQMEFSTNNPDDNWMTVMGNHYLLKVACKNLIENACKFSEDHQCFIQIATTKKMVKISFSDNGVGITDEDLEHIFTPFYRGKNLENYSGYGIGLPLTQKILLQHNGKLQVITTPEQGSTFTLSLPHLAGR